MPRRIETYMIPGPAGKLEALLEEPEDQEPRAAALVCHPHPQHGGTMHNKVVYRIARGLRRSGYVVLRFNYRGVNLSEATYDHGRGETDDARACLRWLRDLYPQLPYALAGFSFGSRIAFRLGCEANDALGILAVGFVAAYGSDEYLSRCITPKVFLHSTRDQFGAVTDLERIVAATSDPKKLVLVPSEDHFFKGALEEFEDAVKANAF